MHPRTLLAVAVIGLFLVFCVPGPQFVVAEPETPAKPVPIDYNRDIRPILAKNCFACHGPDVAQRAAGLRLDVREAAVKERRHGAALVPGKPDKSTLVARITATDETERMPPKETGHYLTDEQIARLKRWITEGVTYAEHWAWVKPQRPDAPAVQNRAWVRNPIDTFVLARLEKAGLRPSEEADKYALLRRASLDLRGLPPTPSEVEEFANDTTPNAYERAVDRFLKDSAYGERWARMWLDLARYADSAGYGSDPLRPNIWPYRDWVIDAFNRNLPFDQFTIEQLAGDLLPSATLQQKMATAFHRNTMTNTEGGTDDEEFRVAAVKDRVDTTLQVWMGLTMGCAKCHNHKFDPITNQEYYQVFAFFNQTADSDRGDEGPTLAVLTPLMEEQARQLETKLAELRRKLDTPTPELTAAQARWEATLGATARWVGLEPTETRTESGATLKLQPDQSLKVEGKGAETDAYTLTARTDLKGITAFRLETLPDVTLPGGGAGRAADGNFVLSRFGVTVEPDEQRGARAPAGRFVRIELPGQGKILSLAEVQVFSKNENVARAGEAKQSSTDYEGDARRAIDGNTNGDYFEANSVTHTATEANPWWEVKLTKAMPVDQIVVWNRTDGTVGSRLAGFRIQLLDESRKVLWQQEVKTAPSPKEELSLSGRLPVSLTQATADHSQDRFPVTAALSQPDLTKSGWAVAPRITEPHQAVFAASAPLPVSPAVLTVRLEHRFPGGYTLGRFRLSVTSDPQALERARVPRDVLAILDVPAAKRTREQQEKLAAHYRTNAPELKSVRDEIAKLEQSLPKAPALPVMEELPENRRRVTTVLIKGNFLEKGEKVNPGVPSAFHALPRDATRNRLGVAKWLMSPDNPLTARVAANRFWAQLWGVGLVETEEDFGTQGELPTHPQLLDWLATEYVRLGWDTKAFLKLLVTSATYRQSSKVSPEALAKDPTNRLFTRAPRFRLEAEMVRDQALALSGLLSRKLGGPSVYPPQPPGLWQAAFNGQRTWPTSTGEDRYRRGLYTFWRRTIPYPSMAAFDAPSRETCTVRRVRTNTPLQAFVTLNDPVYVEAAQALARRILTEGGATSEERAKFALSLVLCRPARPEQVKHVLELHASEREHFRKDVKAAEKLATDPLGALPAGMEPAEAAAWTVVANILLNLDGVLTKG